MINILLRRRLPWVDINVAFPLITSSLLGVTTFLSVFVIGYTKISLFMSLLRHDFNFNQDGTVVITFKRTFMVYKRGHVPEFASSRPEVKG